MHPNKTTAHRLDSVATGRGTIGSFPAKKPRSFKVAQFSQAVLDELEKHADTTQPAPQPATTQPAPQPAPQPATAAPPSEPKKRKASTLIIGEAGSSPPMSPEGVTIKLHRPQAEMQDQYVDELKKHNQRLYWDKIAKQRQAARDRKARKRPLVGEGSGL